MHHEWADDTCSIADEQKFARVVYVPVGTNTATAEEPDHDEEMFCNMTLDFVGREYDLFATINAELPSWIDGADPLRRHAMTVRSRRPHHPANDRGGHMAAYDQRRSVGCLDPGESITPPRAS
ncbi:hypothetical protein [Actinoallomurus sp. NPDC050550]|uniref:hypothetical protein n=1 Tax=Actinoallomurus sp. NPDC050550 TaxID=3154937 RepID=UPI0033C7A378